MNIKTAVKQHSESVSKFYSEGKSLIMKLAPDSCSCL